MARAIEITQAELLDAIAAAATTQGPDGAATVAEMQTATGMSATKVRQALKRFQVEGRLSVVSVTRLGIDGTNRRSPAYTIRPAKKR